MMDMYCDECEEFRTVLIVWPSTHKCFKCGKVLFQGNLEPDYEEKFEGNEKQDKIK